MDAYVFMIVLASIFATAWMVAAIVRARSSALHAAPVASGDTERLQAEVAAMKERLAVLERIATDEGRLLGEEIDRLRQLPSSRNLHGSEAE
jgi:hypothetical protein